MIVKMLALRDWFNWPEHSTHLNHKYYKLKHIKRTLTSDTSTIFTVTKTNVIFTLSSVSKIYVFKDRFISSGFEHLLWGTTMYTVWRDTKAIHLRIKSYRQLGQAEASSFHCSEGYYEQMSNSCSSCYIKLFSPAQTGYFGKLWGESYSSRPSSSSSSSSFFFASTSVVSENSWRSTYSLLLKPNFSTSFSLSS